MKETLRRLSVADQIRKGLEEAVRHAKGETTLKTTTLEVPDRPPELGAEDVTRIRLNSQMSQVVFAQLLNVSPKTVQSWEHGTRKPSQAALRLIQVFERNPQPAVPATGCSSAISWWPAPRNHEQPRKEEKWTRSCNDGVVETRGFSVRAVRNQVMGSRRRAVAIVLPAHVPRDSRLDGMCEKTDCSARNMSPTADRTCEGGSVPS
jgi:putative transcriptional regulator